MLYNRKELPEIFYIKHIHDTGNEKYMDYENNILNKSLSPYIYENDLMSDWLNKMQPLTAVLFDQMNVVKNFKNYMVDKYEWRQK
jgi:hypothetical protein